MSLGICQRNWRPANSPVASPPTCTVKGGAALWKNCSAWSLEKMIQRSGLSARSRSPMSAATARTCSTFALSSVSGMVKNCGACGSIAPPMTVDVMAPLLMRQNYRPKGATTSITTFTGVSRARPDSSRPPGSARVDDFDGDLGPARRGVVVLGAAAKYAWVPALLYPAQKGAPMVEVPITI